MIICLVLLVFLGTLSGIVIKTVLNDRGEARMELIRNQARIFLEDGLHRAEILRKADANFSGETLELFACQTNPPGSFRLTSVYKEDKNAFDIEVLFLDENKKTILARRNEQ